MVEILVIESLLLINYIGFMFIVSLPGGLNEKNLGYLALFSAISIFSAWGATSAIGYWVDIEESNIQIIIVFAPACMLLFRDCFLYYLRKKGVRK